MRFWDVLLSIIQPILVVLSLYGRFQAIHLRQYLMIILGALKAGLGTSAINKKHDLTCHLWASWVLPMILAQSVCATSRITEQNPLDDYVKQTANSENEAKMRDGACQLMTTCESLWKSQQSCQLSIPYSALTVRSQIKVHLMLDKNVGSTSPCGMPSRLWKLREAECARCRLSWLCLVYIIWFNQSCSSVLEHFGAAIWLVQRLDRKLWSLWAHFFHSKAPVAGRFAPAPTLAAGNASPTRWPRGRLCFELYECCKIFCIYSIHIYIYIQYVFHIFLYFHIWLSFSICFNIYPYFSIFSFSFNICYIICFILICLCYSCHMLLFFRRTASLFEGFNATPGGRGPRALSSASTPNRWWATTPCERSGTSSD